MFCWSKCKCSLSMYFIIGFFSLWVHLQFSHYFTVCPIHPAWGRLRCFDHDCLFLFHPFRPLTVQNVKMCWNLSHSGAEVSLQLDIPSTKTGEGAQYLFLYLRHPVLHFLAFASQLFYLNIYIDFFILKKSLFQRQRSLLVRISWPFFFIAKVS